LATTANGEALIRLVAGSRPARPTSIFRPVAAIHDDAAAVMFDQLEAGVGALKLLRKTVSGGMSPTAGLDQRRM
jgi:hypothetical protein